MKEKIAIVYLGLSRFEKIGKANHRELIDKLKELWDVVEYNFIQPNLDRSSCPFPSNDTGAARIQVWDFYTALDLIKEKIIIKLRSDIWFSKSSINAVISEVNLITNRKQDISYMGCDSSFNFSEKYVKMPTKKGKVLDLVIIVNKDKIRKKEEALQDLQQGKLAHLRSGNSTFKVLITPQAISTKVFCQIYIIRKEVDILNDWTIGWNFLEYYLADTVVEAKQWWANNKDKQWL